MTALFLRLLRDDGGQDVIEYALLTATVGLAALAVVSVLGATIGQAYSAVQSSVNGLWVTPNPG